MGIAPQIYPPCLSQLNHNFSKPLRKQKFLMASVKFWNQLTQQRIDGYCIRACTGNFINSRQIRTPYCLWPPKRINFHYESLALSISIATMKNKSIVAGTVDKAPQTLRFRNSQVTHLKLSFSSHLEDQYLLSKSILKMNLLFSQP